MWYEYKNDVLRLFLYIQPGAKSTEISGLHDGALKIRLHASPIEGQANDALIRYLAKCFKVPRKQVKLVRGDKSRRKTCEILGSSVIPSDLMEDAIDNLR